MIDDAGMAGANERRRRLTFVERCLILGIDLDRAHFLAACSRGENTRKTKNEGIYIPYDDNVQLREAARLGINALDTARMMGTPLAEVLSRGITFPAKSTHPIPEGFYVHNLFTPDTGPTE
jgi:hypothetical protein